jgi:hypothetical protein
MKPTPAVPFFDTPDAASRWYNDNIGTHDTHDMRDKRTHLFPTLTSWRDVERELLPAVRALPQCQRRCTSAKKEEHAFTNITRALAAPVYARAATNPDAALNTLRYLFFHTRCGIWVSIRNGVVALFVPFANATYRNNYGHRLKLTGRDLSVDAYCKHKSETLRRRPEAVLSDPGTWWMNGGILCNVMPDNIWGDEYVAAIRNMLDETCAARRDAAVPDLDFFINKRDYPQLRADLHTEPYGEFIGEGVLERESYTAYAPVFSFYTGTDVADVPMPTTEDWILATGRCFPPGSRFGSGSGSVGFTFDAEREMRAVFRGTASGHGITAETNTRLRLAVFGAARPDLVDAGVTAFNTRDKIIQNARTVEDAIEVGFCTEDSAGVSRVPFMSMAEQTARFAYILYADGHCAASRYGALMASGSVILRVESVCAHTSGSLWLFHNLTSAIITSGDDEPDTVPLHADHFSIAADLGNLEATIVFLRRHSHIAARTAAAAHLLSPTVDSITAFWRASLVAAHDKTVSDTKTSLGCKEWFSPYDAKYARVKSERASKRDGVIFTTV